MEPSGHRIHAAHTPIRGGCSRWRRRFPLGVGVVDLLGDVVHLCFLVGLAGYVARQVSVGQEFFEAIYVGTVAVVQQSRGLLARPVASVRIVDASGDGDGALGPGPRGEGTARYVRHDGPEPPFIGQGGGHQQGLKAGTLDTGVEFSLGDVGYGLVGPGELVDVPRVAVDHTGLAHTEEVQAPRRRGRGSPRTVPAAAPSRWCG